MNFWEAIVLIVIITSVAKMFGRSGRASRDDRASIDHDESAVQNQRLNREVEELRERIKVLERIATEDRKASDLANEIESLRR
jgi:hypothetical protein